MDERDPKLDPWFAADAKAASQIPSTLWAAIEGDLDRPGWRDRLVSLSTPQRRVLAVVVVLLVSALQIGMQGVRGDLDGMGWLWFALSGGTLAVGGLSAFLLSLRSHAKHPFHTSGALGLLWGFLALWMAFGPFPGMVGVPAAMHLYCFEVTAVAVVAGALTIGLLERSRRPAVWRIALGTAGAGLVGFATQSVFCPGIDLVHLVIGHAGPGVVVAALAATLAWLAHLAPTDTP